MIPKRSLTQYKEHEIPWCPRVGAHIHQEHLREYISVEEGVAMFHGLAFWLTLARIVSGHEDRCLQLDFPGANYTYEFELVIIEQQGRLSITRCDRPKGA